MSEKIEAILKKAPVVLFMKGTAERPYCGFSQAVVSALKSVEVDFDDYDVLADEDLRGSLKQFFDWPTFPMLCVKGELVGGCDIVLELLNLGKLEAVCKGIENVR